MKEWLFEGGGGRKEKNVQMESNLLVAAVVIAQVGTEKEGNESGLERRANACVGSSMGQEG